MQLQEHNEVVPATNATEQSVGADVATLIV
jgi:hypothetical protein